MSGISPFIVIPAVLIIVLLLGAMAVFWKKRKGGKPFETDYRAFFYLGIVFTVIGMVFTIVVNPGWIGFTVMGVLYIAIGAKNRDRWKKRKYMSPPKVCNFAMHCRKAY